jgi:hypothetical protein
VHQATTVSTVRDDSGRVLARGVVPTEATALVEYFCSASEHFDLLSVLG